MLLHLREPLPLPPYSCLCVFLFQSNEKLRFSLTDVLFFPPPQEMAHILAQKQLRNIILTVSVPGKRDATFHGLGCLLCDWMA